MQKKSELEISNETKSILSTLNVDNSKNKLFFGKPLGIERYDNPKYSKLAKFFDNQILFYWRPEVITMDDDAKDFKKLTKHQEKLFTKNLGFQMVLDTVQSRGIGNLLEYVTNLELEQAFIWWQAFENLHSYSYTYIIRSVYPNPSEVLDNIQVDEDIMKRVYGVTKYYDDYINSLSDDEHDIKKKLWLTLVSIQILEAVRFYVSFACSYFFDKKLNLMRGNAKIIKLINRDENLHFALTKDLMNILRDHPEEGFQEVIAECEPIVQQMWKDAAQEEMDWADYLFEDNPVGYSGFNAEILKQFMKYRVNMQMKLCRFEPIFEKTNNPIKWIDEYINTKNVQNAPQENENVSYVVNAVDTSNMGDLGSML